MYFCVLCIVCFVTCPVLFVCICVLSNCHRVTTQLQLTNISYQLGQADLSDTTRSGRPVTASDHLHQDHFEDFVDLVIL